MTAPVQNQQAYFLQLINLADQVETRFQEHKIFKGEGSAVESAKQLYFHGIEMVAAIYHGQSLIGEEIDILPVIAKIYSIMKQITNDGYHNFSINRTLSKVFSIFLELRWHQVWSIPSRDPIFSDMKDELIEVAKEMQTILNKPRFLAARLEFRCAEQAARRLKSNEVLWKKYLGIVVKGTVPTAVGLTTALVTKGPLSKVPVDGLFKAVKQLAAEITNDASHLLYPWYETVVEIRWRSLVDPAEFAGSKAFRNICELSRNEGGNYSNCLSVALMRVVKNCLGKEGMDQYIKKAAYEGFQFSDGTQSLTLFELTKIKSDKNKIVRLASGAYRAATKRGGTLMDPFSETRKIAVGYVLKFVTKEKYRDFREKASQALKEIPNTPEYKSEFELIISEKRQLVSQRNQKERELEVNRDEQARLKSQAEVDQEKIKKLNQKERKLEKERDELQSKIDDLSKEVDSSRTQIDDFQNELSENKDREKDFRGEISALLDQTSRMSEDSDNFDRREIENINSRVRDCEGNQSRLQDLIETISEKISAEKDRIRDKEDELEKTKDRIAEVEQQLKETKSERREAENRIIKTESEIKELELESTSTGTINEEEVQAQIEYLRQMQEMFDKDFEDDKNEVRAFLASLPQ